MRSSLLLLDLAAAASLFAGTTAAVANNDNSNNIGSPLVERAPPSCTNIPKTPPPQGLVCGKQGTVKNPKAIRTFNSNSDNCVESCLSTTACISFSYGPGRKCTLYSTNIYGSGFKAGPTGVTWSNRRCYARSCNCPTGLTNCSGDCVDTGSDENNCGACGKVAGTGKTCCNGKAVDLMTDSNSCGACGIVCEDPRNTCCGGQCTSLASDENNCGTCGTAVGEGETCCSGQSVDTTTNDNNCGSCGTMCTGATNRCIQSVCTDPTPVCSQVPVITENQELIRNGGFEDGSGAEAPPWNRLSVLSTYTGAPNSGFRFLSMINQKPVVQGGAVQSVLSAVEGRLYTLSFKLRINDYTDHDGGTRGSKPCTFTVNWGDDPTLYSQVINMNVNPQVTYELHQVDNIICPTLDANGNAAFAIIYSCAGFQSGDTTTISVDDVSLKGPTVSYTESCSTPGVTAPTARP